MTAMQPDVFSARSASGALIWTQAPSPVASTDAKHLNGSPTRSGMAMTTTRRRIPAIGESSLSWRRPPVPDRHERDIIHQLGRFVDHGVQNRLNALRAREIARFHQDV